MPNPRALRIELALKGRSLKTYTFAKQNVTIGRDPEADVVLDNMGVSRHHASIEWVNGTYFLRDEGSANGTFLNGDRTHQQRLADRDVINIGKFSLLVSLPAAAGTTARAQGQAAAASATPMDGTMVLTSDQLARVLHPASEQQREQQFEQQRERQPALGLVTGSPSAEPQRAATTAVMPWIMAMVGALLIGLAIGAAIF